METKPRFEPYVPSLTEELFHQGKVRDTYRTDVPGTLLVVATDRLSTHNVVHESLVPAKGQILTALTVFWGEEVLLGITSHLLAFGQRIYDYLPADRTYPDDLHLRGIIVDRLTMIPYEMIFRGRMAGSLWKDFYRHGLPNPYGAMIPPGLQLMDPFETPVFTPTEKSEDDDPVSALTVEREYPRAVKLARDVYQQGRMYALRRGLEIVDAKIEMGLNECDSVVLADEFLTPDCCRFVYNSDIEPGKEPPWADKEIFRQDAVRQWGWASSGPPLTFPEEVIAEGAAAYCGVFETLTGQTLEEFQEREF
jgi:phosphoribosylaminoimidazole-succinocarboxamide synthase